MNTSLQENFQKFRKERFENYKLKKLVTPQHDRKKEQWKNALREKFTKQAEKYFGVPYSADYHLSEDDPYHNAPLYLDCSGLIRQIIYDLREDFGFTLGKWNQAYQYDLLDQEIMFEQLKPGDLIFLSAKYYDKNARPFQHDIVHVEIYVGGGSNNEATIAARLQNGVIQKFDTFRFISKNYTDIKYHFKSIDPWLEGIYQNFIRSFCSKHPWRDDRNIWISEKFSVFTKEEQKQLEECSKDQQKLVYVGQGNNEQLIKSYFQSKDQYRLLETTKDAYRTDFFFKWVQSPTNINFAEFNEKNQIVNHTPNARHILGEKIQLLELMRSTNYMPLSFRLDLLPETLEFLNYPTENEIWILKPYNLNQGRGIQLISDIKTFKQDLQIGKQYQIGDYYMKFVQQEREKLKEELLNQMNIPKQEIENQPRTEKYHDIDPRSVIQKYIEKPLLIEGRKFDLRCYALIACVNPFIVFYRPGYARLSLLQYSLEDVENNELKVIHLTNAAIQRGHPLYKQNKQNQIWNMNKFENYMKVAHQNLNLIDINEKIKRMITTAMLGAKKQLQKLGKKGQFELLGVDILLDSNYNPYLLEMNVNPALFTDCETLQELLPTAIYELLDLEILLHSEYNQQLEIAKSLKNFHSFEILINEAINYEYI